MPLTWTPFALPLFAATAICAAVAVLGRSRRGPGATAFSLLLASVALWSTGYAVELMSSSLPQKLLWAKVQYVGIATIPVFWLVFSLQYADAILRPRLLALAALLAVPATTLILLFNVETTGMVWRNAALVPGGSFDLLRLTYGPWFWVHAAYSYVLWGAATGIVLLAMARARHVPRGQKLAVALAVVCPGILSVVYVAGLIDVDLTPFGFTICGVALFWTMTRQRFLAMTPIPGTHVLEGIQDGVVVVDADERIVDLNPAAAHILGESVANLMGRAFGALLPRPLELRDIVRRPGDAPLEAELGDPAARGTYELRSWPLSDPSSHVEGRVIVLRDVTEERETRETLRGTEERLRVLIEQMPAVLWTTDTELRFTQMLGAALQQMRLPPDAAKGMELSEFFGTTDNTHPAIAAHLQALDGVPSSCAVELFGRDFECHVEALLDADGERCGIIGVGFDVTERQNLEEQLQQSQKMEAIGRMAGGVAHDFNNLLTAVAGYAQLAQEDLGSISEEPRAAVNLQRDLDAIAHAAERATSITAQLLAFSRRQVLQPRVLRLNGTLEEMEKMLRRLVGSHVELIALLDPECHPVKVDPVQVQQVVINLVLNARDAMPNGGKVTIETANIDVTESHPTRYDVIEPGTYVLLTVSDDGFGMDERTRAHVFEPFFTTKEEGKGTGLGLATVYGIVKQTGGYIEVTSEVGDGSIFQIYFPTAPEDEVADNEEILAVVPGRLQGDETVLLVEDEEMVRVLATRVLSGNGYQVLEAEEAEEALEVCRRHEGPIDLLVTDVVMPGINGRELAERMSALLPGLSVLYVSGYTGGALVEHGVLRDGTNFLQKPFSPRRLVLKVREVLDGSTTRA